jgi:hypothetical protein
MFEPRSFIKKVKPRLLACLVSLMFVFPGISLKSLAINDGDFVRFVSLSDGFSLVASGKAATIVVSAGDFEGVNRVADIFCDDIERVSGIKTEVINTIPENAGDIILIGTVGKSPLIGKLIETGKLDVSAIEGKWESFQIEVVDKPMKGVGKALVIAGSDKRGTIFGMFDISEKMGVSPWYWWADAAPKKHDIVSITPGKHIMGEPKVKYRGIFINDEAPALSGWIGENYGDFNHKFYEPVFELILRMKGNYLWPAMWGRAFYDDDSLNAPLADKYGIVIGTSHHEPLMRAHAEWARYGKGPWNYEKNAEVLRDFWTGSMIRMNGYESIVTVGMRGDGDEAMSEETTTDLLERIVMDQRKIIEETTGKPAGETPQIWALYKEVQEYYDQGMRVPEDITLLLCDDNWGNVRVLPNEDNRNREGGFGIYYHYDFVGGPVSYKWLNVTQIEKVWEQMNLSHRYGAERIWLVNVGDIKPMELPISFFLDFAWDPDAWTADNLDDYHRLWAAQQFGEEQAGEIGEILALYTKYNARRHPEMLSPELYSLTNYREAETVVADYNALAARAKAIYATLSEEDKDAFYQLVLFPVEICANLNELYLATAKNRMYAAQGRNSTNHYAEEVKKLFDRDASLTDYFHHEMADGKWNHMMSQTHIGYTSWNQPEKNFMPEVKSIKTSDEAKMGLMVEGSAEWWPKSKTEAILPQFDPMNDQEFYIEVFSQGQWQLNYEIRSQAEWIKLSETFGETTTDSRINVSIDWNKAPEGKHENMLLVRGAGKELTVKVKINKLNGKAKGFVENNGVVSIEAAHYSKAVNTNGVSWLTIPNLGRTGSGITPSPVTAPAQTPGDQAPHLEYEFYMFAGGNTDVTVYMSPTLNFMQSEGLRYAISVDDEEPRIINIHEGEDVADWKYPEWWNTSVTEAIRKETSSHTISGPGTHVLKFWMVDPGIVLQKIVIDAGGLKASYLGPPESIKK